MRAILLILILAVVALIAVVQTGLIHLNQTAPAVAPGIEANDGKLTARPGQAPAFDIETGSVGVGTRPTQVPLPSVELKPSGTTVNVPSVEVRRPAETNDAATAR